MSGYERSARFFDVFESVDTPSFFRKYATDVDTVLDVGAGTGQVTLTMANEGTTVVAVEPSEAMREVFEEKLSSRPTLRERVRLVPGSAQAFEWNGEAEAAVMVESFDHLLTHDNRVRALENVAAHLCPGARLIFDATVWEYESHALTEAGSVERDGRRYERHVAREVFDERVEIRWIYRVYENGELVQEVEQPSTNAVYDVDDVRAAVDDAGLSIDSEWSDFEGTPFEDGEDFRVVVEVEA